MKRNKKERNREERMKSKSPNNADGARDQGVLLIGWLSGSGKTPSRWSRDPLCPPSFSVLIPIKTGPLLEY